jgi:inhibitor of KinA
MNKFELKFKPYGDTAILIEWPSEISESILEDIRIFSQKIQSSNVKGIIDVNFVYASLLVVYENLDCVALCDTLRRIYLDSSLHKLEKQNVWYIPVCYEYGLDLEEILANKKLNKKDFVSIHTAPFYTVYGVGFLPGFLYLGGLNEELFTPRKEVPRIEIEKGSVAIGGNQTGIYPQNSPGGWHIIGKTPVPFFDSNKKDPTFVKPGDKIKFYSISKSRFKLLEIEVESEVYNLKKVAQ